MPHITQTPHTIHKPNMLYNNGIYEGTLPPRGGLLPALALKLQSNEKKREKKTGNRNHSVSSKQLIITWLIQKPVINTALSQIHISTTTKCD